MNDSPKLKDMLAGIKTSTVSNPTDYVNFDQKQVSSELEDITYFIDQAKKYRNKKTVARAALACQALGVYLESLVKDGDL